MAIYGTLGEVDLGALEASIADTAVDVFVYDTRKDSDGGQWRHRCQHTSWYNETLNTATRGTRREFPAVAVIVAQSDKVTIYDGDDPDLPMWMVFNSISFGLFNNNNPVHTILSVSALNGVLCGGGNQYSCVGIVNFVADTAFKQSASSASYAGLYFRGKYLGNIAQRNSSLGFDGLLHGYSDWVVSDPGNDVAMTVLPNAPIDSATGLPIPTIAVATNGGVSVIKDDGTVVDMTRPNYYADFVEFIEYNGIKLLCYLNNNSGVEIYSPGVFEIPNSDVDFGDVVLQRFTRDQAPIALGALQGPPTSVSNSNIDKGNSSGLTRIYLQGSDNTTKVQSAAVYITSDYNTGWMHGDIKGAFLSDTDDTDVTGSGTDLIHGNDSTFDDIIANLNWSERSGSGGAWNVSGGVLKTGTVSSGEYLDITTSGYTSGQTYVISYVLSNVTGSMPLRWRFNNGQMGNLPTSNGPQSYYVTLTETGTLFSLLNDANLTADIDNFKLQLVKEEDRSVNNKGLQVYGTVTKTPVATGAELVSYNSSTDNSGYLQKPLTSSDFDLTSPWSISFWVEKIETGGSGSAYSGIQIAQDDLSSNSSYSKIPFSIYLRKDAGDIGFRGTSVTGFTIPDPFISLNVWRCFTTTFDGSGTLKFYMDGIYQYSTPATFVNPSNKYSLQIMSWSFNAAYYKNDNYNFSLFKMSNSAPSPEQIKKIYEDEKVLFQENAACTLYGSSDAVTALAYDDTTSLLHVGTSSGRSEFKGLRRVGNTTTAVTTAISASSGLVAEQ